VLRPWLLGLWALSACAAHPAPEPQPRASEPRAITAEAWPEADALFRSDPRWLGGDGAVSIALGPGRVLWLFGDSFVAERAPATRASARFVRNSVAVQQGTDPSDAVMRFYAGRAVDGGPASFFAEQGDAWFWPGHGLYHDGALTLFLMRVQGDTSSAASLGFRVAGFRAVRVAGADGSPDAWRIEDLQVPDTGSFNVVGATVLREGEHVYAYAVREPGDHAVALLRWPLADFLAGELKHPTWFAGAGRGFGSEREPAVVIAGGAPEFSVSPAPRGGYVQVQAHGFGAAAIGLRFAPAPAGPFGDAVHAYRPEEGARANVLIYAARAHPELGGADLVVTYASNTLDGDVLMEDLSLYFPRFVRIGL
jgi:hypothetical protein